MSAPLMQCGCVAYAVDSQTREPVCITHGCREVDPEPPSLAGREATCCYGNHGRVASSYALAFFVRNPERSEDTYYCGCWGWD